MIDNIIETKNLSFDYGNEIVLKDISINVPRGSIYGYLGKNGAGKTTTINLILKLLSAKKDTIFYNQEDITTLNENYFKNISFLSQPIPLYSHFTCIEQLKYINCFYNVCSSNIDRVLKEVDMFDQRNKKVKSMSAGMKQRLAIAMSLLQNSDLLILDEPINGLDPKGIHEFRELMLSLNKDGKTIFVSSHILGEMQKMCSHIGIIDSGEMLLQDNLSNMSSLMSTEINLKTSDIDLSIDILTTNQCARNIRIKDNSILCDIANDAEYSKIISLISGRNIDIYDISRKEIDLESIYLTLIK